MKEQILKLRAEGKTYNEITAEVGCAKSTVSYHLSTKGNFLRRQRIKRQEKKQALVDYKGGECVKCGYNKCIDALEFHHRDSELKSFTINVSKHYNLKRLKKEADKCDLLCANCHREFHADERNEIIIARK